MKIGEFASKFNINKTTIRYYTEKNLLLPRMDGTYPDYDSQCVRDMQDILDLKTMGFSIEEIMRHKSKERFHISLKDKDKVHLNELMSAKVEEHHQLIRKTQQQIQLIRHYKMKNDADYDYRALGVPLSCLSMLVCSDCHHNFYVEDAYIENNQLCEGILRCKCGKTYLVEDGVIKQSEWDNSIKSKLRHIKEEDINYLSNYQHALLRKAGTMMSGFLSNWAHEKGILFINADTDILMMNIIEQFKEEGIYIFTSYDEVSIMKLKRKLSDPKYKGHFMFILYVDELPLKKNIPYLVDNAGEALDKILEYPDLAIQKLKSYLNGLNEVIYLSYEALGDSKCYINTYTELGLDLISHESVGKFLSLSEVFADYTKESESELIIYHFHKKKARS